jgi:hypothetical protein
MSLSGEGTMSFQRIGGIGLDAVGTTGTSCRQVGLRTSMQTMKLQVLRATTHPAGMGANAVIADVQATGTIFV